MAEDGIEDSTQSGRSYRMAHASARQVGLLSTHWKQRRTTFVCYRRWHLGVFGRDCGLRLFRNWPGTRAVDQMIVNEYPVTRPCHEIGRLDIFAVNEDETVCDRPPFGHTQLLNRLNVVCVGFRCRWTGRDYGGNRQNQDCYSSHFAFLSE